MVRNKESHVVSKEIVFTSPGLTGLDPFRHGCDLQRGYIMNKNKQANESADY